MMKKNLLGVMQGRLLPKYKGRYQAHPLGYWQKEFQLASEIGLDCIEFILDYNDYLQNPLMSQEGIEEIEKEIKKTNVSVISICADYFMEAPLHSPDKAVVLQSQSVLRKLLENSIALGVKDIVIPCVDQSSIKSEEDKKRFVDNLGPLIEVSERSKINLSLETDLNPQFFTNLLSEFHSNRITVNYDIGNSASLGYDPKEELECYGNRISDIHIKDRILGGGSVILGSGNAQFDLFFRTLKDLDYKGPFIMQAFRDDEGVGIFKSQLQWIESKIQEYTK
ncbi:TIM barrel protein [Leptospira sp. 201903070]|uniref:TIM barrel protein n=1 Tax=Leptospira ainlahdjerensis TaxID=2810033 RepID=A0ABS2UAA9_9LEPT|nr:sugar phosphate isomerase/epimerase family protein [Leptospira ainlahdjerensis]MBM9577317.1 TIM barrel protein [Leptospira ainlahdjerensis]